LLSTVLTGSSAAKAFRPLHFFEDRRLLQPLSEQSSANTKNSTEQKCDAPADARERLAESATRLEQLEDASSSLEEP